MSRSSALLRGCTGGALLGIALLLSGCQGAIQGHWRLQQAIPNRYTFALDKVSFNADGTYRATATLEGITTEETGKYEFSGFHLKLHPDAGGRHDYTAQLSPGMLQLSSGSRKVVLRSSGG
jgi:hypothetical protein